MSKYSDHATMGGQVLAHRIRMMKQNWNIIWIIGRVCFLLSFIFSSMIRWRIQDIWNYLCILKAVIRDGMVSLPSSLFSNSLLWFKDGSTRWMSDYLLAKDQICLEAKEFFEAGLFSDLKVSICVGIGSMIFSLMFNKYFGKSLSDKKQIISGKSYVDAKTLKKQIKKKSDITLAGIPYVKNTESRHTIITGTTGSGKTNVFHELIQQVIEKEERAIIVDTVGTFVDCYFNPERDILLNPLDMRSVPWSLISECSNNQVILKQVAECFIKSNNFSDSFWDDAAKIVFVDALKKIIKENKTEEQLLKMLQCSASEWQQMLKDTCGASLMDKEAEKMAISIRATLINDLDCLQYLKLDRNKSSFKIKKWIESGKGLLFLACTPAQRAVVKSLISAWLTIAAEAMLHTVPTDKRTWFFIDELHNLRRLPRFETYLAEVRKFGGCFVLGTQMVSQLNRIYGAEDARTIIGQCGTKVVMNVPEPITARYMGDFLGKKEQLTAQESISYGANTIRDGVNLSQHKEIRDIVSTTEIMNLKIGEAFVQFSGIETVGKVQFKYHEVDIKLNGKSILIHYLKTHKRLLALSCLGGFLIVCVLTNLIMHSLLMSSIFATIATGTLLWLIIDTFNVNMLSDLKIFGEIIPSEKYQNKYPQLFGNYLEIADLKLSEKAFNYPIFLWSSNEELYFEKILEDARRKQIPTLIFEDKDGLYKKFAKSEDITIDFSSDEGFGWDFCKDFKQNLKISEYINLWTSVDCRDYLECFRNSKLENSSLFLKTLCFATIDTVEEVLEEMFSNISLELTHVRSSIAKDFDFLSVIKTKQKNLALSENTEIVWIQNASPKLNKFILETAPKNTLCLVKQKNSHSIKRSKTIVLNSSFNEFHIRFDGSYISLNSNNQQVVDLFGKTLITDIMFAKTRYTNTNYPAVSEENLNDNIFKYYEKNEICEIK